MLVQARTEDLVADTKRICAVLDDPSLSPAASATRPPGLVWSRVEGRQWILTVRGTATESLDLVRATGAKAVDVQDMSLDDIFRDVVRGYEAGLSKALPTEVASCS
jgi:hypothetical protein